MVQKVKDRIFWFKNINQNYFYDNVNKYGVKCRTSLEFWGNEEWINSIDPFGWFQWCFRYWLGQRSLDDIR